MQAEKPENTEKIALLAETSWEVCNKIGGIYTVLSTKAKVLKEKYGDSLVFIGPDVWSSENPSPCFKESKTMFKKFSSRVIPDYGVKVRCGKWDIPGAPQVILVDFQGVYPHLDSLFATMWEKFGVDSMREYGDYREGCAFAIASAVVIRNLADHLGIDGREVYAHFNEWTTGMGLLYLRLILPEAAGLFTTHATSIGRSICGNGKPLYDYFDGYNGDQMAGELNMEAKHSLEKTTAKTADCFTAVSELTAREAEKLLDIRPQAVTPNGFEPGFVPGDKKFLTLRKAGRKKLLKLAEILKGKKFSDDTLIVATSGRNEYRNKGLDLYLDSLTELRGLMKNQPGIENGKSGKPGCSEVLALVLVPAWVDHKDEALARQLNSDSVASTEENGMEGGKPSTDFITHLLHNMESDAVACRINSLEHAGVIGDEVNVVYIPCYLDGKDGIVGISYYDLLPAIDITVFASYYEPWGYTPLESIAFGIPTVTSDKSGFGQWVLENMENSIYLSGVSVVVRTDSNYRESAYEIGRQLCEYAGMPEKARMEVRNLAMSTAEKADWKYFIEYYYNAFEIARKRRDQRL